MDIVRHLHFCPPGTPFFDAPASAPDPADDFGPVRDALPAGWSRKVGGEWVQWAPDGVEIPLQGWKIHASATPDSAPAILDTVVKYCVAERVMFKFIRSLPVLRRRNGKYGDRSASGKFVTLYPVDEAQFEKILRELGGLLEGQPGPYILSDLRWGPGPLYVRYGGFALRTARTDTGEQVYCVEDPDGRLVPDRRGPGFRPPEWVTLPDCLAESLAARNAGTLKDFPYRVTQALHFSNGGGVYRGVDTRTGADVLLREARPLAGLDGDGRDAVARHEREHWALRQLDGLDCVPRLVDYRIGHEHYFLVREYVEGRSLSKETLRRNPLLLGETSAQARAEYAAWALDVLDRIDRGVTAMHARGVVFGDLHPGNVLVQDDGTVRFIDFETASAVDADAAQTMAAVGFAAPEGVRGAAVDRYALGCLRLALFAPVAAVLPWGPEKVTEALELVRARFPVPADFAETVRRDLGLPETPGEPSPGVWHGDPAEWPRLRDALAEGIAGTATPDRTDRLFPGDAEQFFAPEGGAGFAYGAAGVLWALAEAGMPVPEEHTDWLTKAALELNEPQPGFWTGLAGIAYALDRLGRADTARRLVDRALDETVRPRRGGLLDGASGLGLTALHFGDTHLEAAVRIAETVTPAPDTGRPPGLLHGASGTALFLIRLYERTGDPALLDRAATALRADLAALGWSSEEGRFGAESVGRLPLISTGSGGTALVLQAWLRHREDPDFTAARDAVLASTEGHFAPQAGVFHGRAGVLAVRLGLGGGADGPGRPGGAAGDPQGLLDPFGLHVVPHDGRPAFLGRENLRVSTDFATGGAGVLAVLDAAVGGRVPRLPFL
ncbi:putative SapB synthase [Streptomyces sp. enrichment culture]|uniref:class III lanthionine synthetase LanKC n=1 Tax=Streptomyces sp. enrichment culture TaxID=1795815 RepID=UPI003F5751DC